MKNLICLCLIALASLNVGCSKDEILWENESKNVEKKSILQNDNKMKTNIEEKSLLQDDIDSKSQSSNYSNSTESDSTNNLPGSDTSVYYLYLNMDLIEQDYVSDPNNPPFSGPFNLYFRNLMANHFTIYQIFESTNSSCGNIERWVVNEDELNQYLTSIGIQEVDSNGIDWYKVGDTNGDNTSDTDTGTSANGGKNTFNPPPPPPPNIPTWLINYQHCFAW